VLVLALDTTSRGGSVAVLRDQSLLALIDGDPSRTHGERLPSEIAAALARAQVTANDLDLLAVASGPGAFTGLRIGLAAIQGLSMVLSKPVVGVSALDALAETAWTIDATAAHVAAWMDAQRGEGFAANYLRTDTQTVIEGTDPIVAPPETLLASAPFPRADAVTFIGDGALRYRSLIEQSQSGRARVIESVPALAPAIARLGVRLAGRGGAGAPHSLRPLYVRRPDAELDRDRQGQP
jgi:tRNA threonylcarbamoyladenosine biosynthesis protein TsaB